MKHLEHGITMYTHEQNLLVFLKVKFIVIAVTCQNQCNPALQEEGICGFSAVMWLPFMQHLASVYGHYVLRDMQTLGVT